MGYGLCSGFAETKYGWQAAFWVQACLLAPSFVGIIVTPNQYIDIQDTVRRLKLMNKEAKKKLEEANAENDELTDDSDEALATDRPLRI